MTLPQEKQSETIPPKGLPFALVEMALGLARGVKGLTPAYGPEPIPAEQLRAEGRGHWC